MAITEPNLGLRIWNLPSDAYDSQQLADNFAKIGQHDHSEGHGVPITTAGIANGAVTAAKLAPGAISLQDNIIDTNALVDGAVTTPKIADGAITEAKLDPNVLPIGSVIPWWRPTNVYPLPTGWLIADGSTVSAHSFGGGPITLPDLRNRFVLGAATSGTGTGGSTPPVIGAAGGAVNHLADFSHTHTMAHTHGVSLSDHSHSFSSNHAHSYGVFFKGLDVNTIGFDASSTLYMLYSSAGLDRSIPNTSATNAGGTTGVAGAATVTSGAASTSTTSSALSTQDIRPQFVGLLYLIKVKHG